MRAPLITLIVILSVSVVGLTLIPGVDLEGRPAFISLFQAFYFMSYTAATIGFGELPWPFSAGALSLPFATSAVCSGCGPSHVTVPVVMS